MTPAPRPLSLKRDGDGLLVHWADGLRTRVTWRVLRKNCPCATCNAERAAPADPFKVLRPEEVAAGPPDAVAMAPVGLYAYQITFNDGHGSGIFPLDALRRLGSPVPQE